MGGSGESGTVSVERANDIHVIPQRGCATSTATRSLLHVPSSAPSTAGRPGHQGWCRVSPERTARGWAATGGGWGVLRVGGAFVQYAQPLASGSRPSWSRPTRAHSWRTRRRIMTTGPRRRRRAGDGGGGPVTEVLGCAVRTSDSLLRGLVSTALTLASPASARSAGIVGILRFLLLCAVPIRVNVSAVDTDAPPDLFPSSSPSPPGPPTCPRFLPERVSQKS